jgi:tetratricopeptide (TPR) repeat protein
MYLIHEESPKLNRKGPSLATMTLFYTMETLQPIPDHVPIISVPFLGRVLTCPRNQVKSAFFRQSPLGEAQLLAGRLEKAQALAEHALILAWKYQEWGHQAYAPRLLGEVAADRDASESTIAEARYRQALTLAEELGMRPLQAHCHRGLGVLYAKLSRREPARAELSAAMALYRAMEMTFWLAQAEAALAQVEWR